MSRRQLARACALVLWSAFAIEIAGGPALAAPKFQGVFMAGNYPGGATFDDFLEPSAQALAFNMSLWSNWDIAGPNKNIDVLSGTTQFGITDAQRYINALAPYQAGGARALNAGDYFYLLYFGHGTFGTRQGTLPGEQAPAMSVWDEALSFPDHTVVTDDELKGEFAKFNPGVGKIFINVSCYSGGFWNGNDTVGGGDLEQLAGTALIASSIESQPTYPGGLGPRPYEPLLLRNLIATAHPLYWYNHGIFSPTLAQWYAVSAVGGGYAGVNRFADFISEEGEEDIWYNQLVSGTSDIPGLELYDPGDLFNDWWGEVVPEPGSLSMALLASCAALAMRRDLSRR